MKQQKLNKAIETLLNNLEVNTKLKNLAKENLKIKFIMRNTFVLSA